MTLIQTSRPRNVNYLRAAGILYGDWGTSKAYVLGLAYALAGRSSFWFIFGISILTLMVGVNYIKICRFYPRGGGVYTSVRERSKVLSLIGAFFLISDYLVTAALSSLSAFHYLGVSRPEVWAILSIALLGLFNLLGPKHTGSFALGLAIPTVIVVICLGGISLPFLPKAAQLLTPISGHIFHDWNIFVGIVVALSGIESIANLTGSMKLDPGSTEEKPSVVETSTPAIIMVMGEVCFFTVLFGLAMNALPGLEIENGNVNAPGYPDVRDAMLRYMGDFFGKSLFGSTIGDAFASVIGIVIPLLLLSAVNTAIVALSSLLFVMGRDKELPTTFETLNRFGVPFYSAILSFGFPIFLLLAIHDIAGLSHLYAIGFVGAIAVNLASTATNKKLSLKLWERCFMLITFAVMALIEVTLFIDKPHARNFVIAVVALGLFLRSLAEERKAKLAVEKAPSALQEFPKDIEGGYLVAVKSLGKDLTLALEEAANQNQPLYVLFVREQRTVVESDHLRSWYDDEDAKKVYHYVAQYTHRNPVQFLYTITSHTAYSISEIAMKKKVKGVIIGRKRKASSLLNVIRGTSVRDFARHLPEQINLIVVY